jgi:ADP-ribose pyrophosphatase
MPETKNSWKTLKTTEVYDNPWIHIDEHNVINPSGNPGIYGTIHFKNLACGIIPLDDDETTWIVGQYRYALDRYSWEIPMGGVAVGTDPLTGAQRELKEETGLTAAQWKKILEVDLSNSVTDETGVVFVAEGLTHGEPDCEETEQIEIRELPFDDLVRMVIDGQISDLLSVAGILKLAAIRSL